MIEALLDAAQAGGVDLFLLQMGGDVFLAHTLGHQGNDGDVKFGEFMNVFLFNQLDKGPGEITLMLTDGFDGLL